MDISPLQQARYAYKPKLPRMLRNGVGSVAVIEGDATEAASDKEKIKEEKRSYFTTIIS